MTKLAPTSGVAVADASMGGQGRGVGASLGERAAATLRSEVSPPGRMPGRRGNGHTTSGADYAMSALADRLHPV